MPLPPSMFDVPSLPPSLLYANPSPQSLKYKRKRLERQCEPSTSQVQDDSIRVDSSGRPSSTSSLPTDSTEPLNHAPAPQRIHALSRRVPAIATQRFLASAPESDGAHEGVERGWSTAPSILGPGTGCPSTPGISSPHPYHLREPHVPKRLKIRRVAPERSSFPKSVPQPSRAFLLPKQLKELQPQSAARGASEAGVEILHTTATHPDTTSPNVDHCGPCPKEEQDRRHSPALVSTPPSVASDDSVLDNFVVEAAAAYASAAQMPNSCGEVDTTERGRKLCGSFLDVFKDLARYRRFLQHRDVHAQNLIDAMQKLLDSGIVEQNLRVIFVVALSRLCQKSELYPKQFFLHDVIRRKGTIAEGAFGVIEKGYLSGKSVCIKIFRMNYSVASDVHSFRRALSREIVPWAHTSHQNILPFLGIIRPDDDYESLAIVSPFLENGNVVDFLKRNPDADRPSFILGVASGMSYLHDNGIVHGDIKGQNVLVTDTDPPRACLADFGFTTVTDKNAIRSEDLSSGPVEGGTTQFEAPELFDPDIACQRTPASDVYAFAMTCYGILTGSIPYPDKRDMQVMLMVRQGARPPIPVGQIYQDRGLTASLWKLMENAWSGDRGARPRASEIVNELLKEPRSGCILGRGRQEQSFNAWEQWQPPPRGRAIMSETALHIQSGGEDSQLFAPCSSVPPILSEDWNSVEPSSPTPTKLGLELPNAAADESSIIHKIQSILRDAKHYGRLLKCIGMEAQIILDCFQSLLDADKFPDSEQLVIAMRRLSAKTGLYPRRYMLNVPIQLVDDQPVGTGSLTDIYRAVFKEKIICLKAFRTHDSHLVEHMTKTYAREAIIWGQLSHPNILPFYGLSTYRSRIAFVVPYAERGNIRQYLIKEPHANRMLLCADTAAGVEYLHSVNLVHGDLKPVNVLVDASRRACLADFGISGVIDDKILHWTSQAAAASGGTARWQAPELHDPDSESFNTMESDVYAWASTCYEIFTGAVPYSSTAKETKVALLIRDGILPTRPPEDDPSWSQHGLTEMIWDLLHECWRRTPTERSTMSEVVARLDIEKSNDTRPLTQEYLTNEPGANRVLLCADTAAGVQYLHSIDLVHGDLKTVNVLVDASGRGRLADFGISGVEDKEIARWTSQSSAASKGGTTRWQAPELHDPEVEDTVHNTKESDVFAWASTAYEIFTDDVPFSNILNETKVALMIQQGILPGRPSDGHPSWKKHGLTNGIWELLRDCWRRTPTQRLTMSDVMSRLEIEKPNDPRPPAQWDDEFLKQFRNAPEAGPTPSMVDLDIFLSKILDNRSSGDVDEDFTIE